MRLKFALAQAVWNTSGMCSPNLLQYHYDLNVFRCRAPPGSCSAGTQFPESDHKGSDLVLNCIPVANILICREEDFMVPEICGVNFGISECGGHFLLNVFHFGEKTCCLWIMFLQWALHEEGPYFATANSFPVFSEGMVHLGRCHCSQDWSYTCFYIW